MATKAAKDKRIKSVRFTLDGSSADLVLEDITLGERIELENHLQMPYALAISSQWFVSDKTQSYLAYLAFRRRNENLTYDEVLDSKSLTIEFDPKEEGEGKPKRPSKRTRGSSGGQHS